MKVINHTIENQDTDTVTYYELDTGHRASIWNYRNANFVYTPKGNYASQKTMQKVFKAISEYMATKKAIND